MARPVKLYHYVFILIDGTARFSVSPHRSKEFALAEGKKVQANPPDYWPPIVGLFAMPAWVETERKW